MKKSIKELAAESPLVKNTNELEYWVLTPMHACDCAHHVDLIKEVYSTTGVELIQYCIDKFKIEQATAWSHRTQQHYKYVTVAPGCPKFDKEKPYYSHRSELNYWSKSYDPNTHCDGVDKDCIVVSSGEAKALRRGSMKQTNKPD
jgi:predicted transcriptional regulator